MQWHIHALALTAGGLRKCFEGARMNDRMHKTYGM